MQQYPRIYIDHSRTINFALIIALCLSQVLSAAQINSNSDSYFKVISKTIEAPISAVKPGSSNSYNYLLPLPINYSAPTLSAKSAIAVDAGTGRVIFAKDPDIRLPMASTTKIMTALTMFTIAKANLNDFTVVVKEDLVGEASLGLEEGQKIKVIDLLYGMLLNSANDCAVAFARYGGSKLSGEGDPVQKYVAEMNRYAEKLGLKNTRFSNPHGLDQPDHFSSARDLAIAGWYALQNPTIASIVKQSTAKLDGYQFFNISNFIRRYPGANGIKPGETDEAGLCLVASAKRNSGQTAIIVLLNSPGLKTESDQLMDYAFSQITYFSQQKNDASSGKPGVSTLGFIGYPYENILLPFCLGEILNIIKSLAQNIIKKEAPSIIPGSKS